jgi:outer membrane protein OmpA-like peptidoglycan-associated protein
MRRATKLRLRVSTLAVAAVFLALPVLAQAEDLLPMGANKSQIDHAFGADDMGAMGHGGGSTGHTAAPHGPGPVAGKPAARGMVAHPGGVAAAPPSLGLPAGVMLRRLGVADIVPVPVEAPSRVVGVPGIQFDFDSAQMTAPSQYLIDQIGDALARRNWFVTVVGHTDAVGDPGYNMDLSQRRAMTVAFYLVNMHGVSPARIAYTGVGPTQPANPADPYAPENRRVTFVLQE